MDGYFKLSVFELVDKLQIFDDVIVKHTSLQTSAGEHKTVNLQQPGDLCQYISDEEARTLTSLAVTGKLNGKDFTCFVRWQELFSFCLGRWWELL